MFVQLNVQDFVCPNRKTRVKIDSGMENYVHFKVLIDLALGNKVWIDKKVFKRGLSVKKRTKWKSVELKVSVSTALFNLLHLTKYTVMEKLKL